jgi:ribosomal protein S12 methylthiotransferase accessory factor
MRLVLPAPFESAGFFCNSTGLASGNHRLEAVCAGICEVIERDALALWNLSGVSERAKRRLVLDSVDAPDVRALVGQLQERKMAIAIWDMTSDVGVASYLCCLSERHDNQRSALGPFWGSGCHLDRGVALARSVTEAAQSRLTVIAGSRDDLKKTDYRRSDPDFLFQLVHERWEESIAVRRFIDAPTLAAGDFETDVASLVARLRGVGLTQVIVTDLTSDRFGIPVVRVIIPGLERFDSEGRVKFGERGRSWRRGNFS